MCPSFQWPQEVDQLSFPCLIHNAQETENTPGQPEIAANSGHEHQKNVPLSNDRKCQKLLTVASIVWMFGDQGHQVLALVPSTM